LQSQNVISFGKSRRSFKARTNGRNLRWVPAGTTRVFAKGIVIAKDVAKYDCVPCKRVEFLDPLE